LEVFFSICLQKAKNNKKSSLETFEKGLLIVAEGLNKY